MRAASAVLFLLSLWSLSFQQHWPPTGLALSSRLHKGLGSQEGGAQALVQADPDTPQVDCTFSYLEVQAMALQETPPQVSETLSIPRGPAPAPTHGAHASCLPSPGHL